MSWGVKLTGDINMKLVVKNNQWRITYKDVTWLISNKVGLGKALYLVQWKTLLNS